MQNALINLEEMKLTGVQVRTNNKNEMNLSSAKIGPMVQRYFQQQVSSSILNRKNPGRTFCAYSCVGSSILPLAINQGLTNQYRSQRKIINKSNLRLYFIE